jgi:hypothetical protein
MVRDWHCFDIHRPTGVISGFCFGHANACTLKRKEAIENRAGKISACTPQRAAACFQVASPLALSRQLWCARTLDNCRIRREYVTKLLRPASRMSECKLVLSTDDFEHLTDFGLPAGTP